MAARADDETGRRRDRRLDAVMLLLFALMIVAGLADRKSVV